MSAKVEGIETAEDVETVDVDGATDESEQVITEAEDDSDAADYDSEAAEESGEAKPTTRVRWARIVGFGVIPVLVVLMAGAAGYLKFTEASLRSAEVARIESVQAASDGTVAMLSYSPDNVDSALAAAQDRLTGSFRDSYTQLINDVVIPGSKEKKISATATVPAAASISATPEHAVVMVYVNQATIIGADAPTDTASAVEVTLDKVDGHWLISGFEPK